MFSSSSTQTASNQLIEQVFNIYTYFGTGSAPTSITTPLYYQNVSSFLWHKDRTNVALPHTFGKQSLYQYTNSNNFPVSPPNFISGTTGNTVSFGASNMYTTDGYMVNSTIVTNKFFSYVGWTGTGSSRLIAHGLGSTPGLILIKSSSGSNTDWYVWHRSLSGYTQGLVLSSTAGTASLNAFSALPDSTYIYLATGTNQNLTGTPYIAYVWAHDAGGFGSDNAQNVVSCGSYVGNGGTSTVSVGYEPQFVMVKNITSSGDWFLVDKMRGASEAQSTLSYWNNNSPDYTTSGPSLYPVQTGFTAVENASWPVNTNANTYVYMTIRRGPMARETNADNVFSLGLSNGATGTAITTTDLYPDMQISRSISTVSNTNVVDTFRGAIDTTGNPTTTQASTIFTNLANGPSLNSLTNTWTSESQLVPPALNGLNSVYWNFKRSPYFFDIVRYTGSNTGSGAVAVSHKLGCAPEMIWVKRTDATSTDWGCYHTAIGNQKMISLNSSAAQTATGTQYWGDTSPTSSSFYTGWNASTGLNGNNYIAYLFATSPGVSKVGSYAGSRSADTVIDCGFGARTTRFLIIKRIDSGGNWYVWDSYRGVYSVVELNSTTVEASYDWLTLTASGFTVNTSLVSSVNIPGAAYMYYAVC